MEERPIRRKEVAKLAGVSEATVSRVLNGVGPIKEETRQRVLEAAERLGYVPSALAQQFARRKSGNLGVILPLLPKVNVFRAFYFSEILSGIGFTAKSSGSDLLLLFREPGEPRDYEKLFRMRKIDACIILGAQDGAEEKNALAELQQAGRPFCLINQRFDGERFSAVDADHRMGSREAVVHLLEQGYRNIWFLNGPSVFSNSRDRLDGYRQALAEAGLPFDESRVLTGNYSRKSGYGWSETVARHIRSGEADAVIAGSDRMAIGLQQGLRELGLAAGKDYALVGCDDSDSARLTDPPLTSIAVPFYEAGCEAASHLLEALSRPDERAVPFEVKLPVRLVVRASSNGKSNR